MDEASKQAISEELASLVGTSRQVSSISERHVGFDLAAAYDIVGRVAALRAARGEKPAGRKAGFTNRNIWGTYGISAPVWNFVFDRTVQEIQGSPAFADISSFPEPLIEPELVLHLCAAPAAGMREAELIACIDWVAPGFEIVYSIFPGWKFNAPEAAAAYGMHGLLFIGPKYHLPRDRSAALLELSRFSVELTSDAGEARKGGARDILDGPLKVLGYIADEIARFPGSAPLRAGEVVTTGTLTDAMPARPGVTWTARFTGIDLERIALQLR